MIMKSHEFLNSDSNVQVLFLFVGILISLFIPAFAGNIDKDIILNWGGDRTEILDHGNLIKVSLDHVSGSGFQSRNDYLFAKIDVQIKMHVGDSAGTVTAFYISSTGDHHDEVDFEFLGKVDGDPYILQTNIFSQGVGKKEMQFFLWFDPTADFHTYTILWTPLHIVLYVDEIPIREFKNFAEKGVQFPQYQPMKFYASLWEADSWATRGGSVKINWRNEPFTAYYRNLSSDGCVWSAGKSSCSSSSSLWLMKTLNYETLGQMEWAQKNFMFYSYCNDTYRFPQGLPSECYLN